ncbi:Hypothetical predicted protein [Mytilus galloprovincialis]|uniref:AAA+ ATPase domain-containing protein n=1 Tax=Mytilus galloprovincialis TaxID=29158 RepID=A0A8B6BYL5_MYTGA|nr:Hypothetical predicted protein [Mytilus galloprovincialis]
METSTTLLPFQSPCTCMVSGATQSGKTTFVMKLLKHSSTMFKIPPVRIVYCYTEFQPTLEQAENTIPNFDLHEGLPSRSDLIEWTNPEKHTVIVLDDMMRLISKSDDALHLVTVLSHHRNCSVIYITQNLFEKGTHFRSISLNIHIFVLMANNRDKKQLLAFASQAFPGEVNYFKEAYEKAISSVSIGGYLICDLSPYTDKRYRLRTSIFPSDDVTVVYTPK